VGILELLGAIEMDLYGSVFWQRQDFRDAGVRLSRLSAICNRVLGDVHLCALALEFAAAANCERQNLFEFQRMTSRRMKTWIKRLGFWGFIFFLIKGLLWLIVPAVVAFLALD
jgi:hypothetical protein